MNYQDLDLLRLVAAALAVKYEDRDLAGRVDELADRLSSELADKEVTPTQTP